MASIIVIAVLVIAGLIGLGVGFAKLFTKGLCRILAIVLAILVAILGLNFVKVGTFGPAPQEEVAEGEQTEEGEEQPGQLAIYTSLVNTFGGLLSMDPFTTQITNSQELAEVLSNSILSSLSGQAESLYEKMQNAGVDTMGLLVGDLLATIVTCFVLWLVSYLVIKYVFYGLRLLLQKIASAPIIHSVDKILGMAFSALLGFVFLVLVCCIAEVVIMKFVPGMQEMLRGILIVEDGTSIGGMLHTISSALLQMLNIFPDIDFGSLTILEEVAPIVE